MNKRAVAVWTFFYALILLSVAASERGEPRVSMVAYVLVLAISIFLPYDILVGLICMLLPIGRVFILRADFYTLIPLLEVVLVAKYLGTLKEYGSVFIASFIMLFTLEIAVSYFAYKLIYSIIPFFVNILFMYVMINKKTDKSNINSLAYLFVLSALFSSIAPKVFPNAVLAIRLMSAERYAYQDRLAGLATNATDYAQFLVIALAFVVILVLSNNLNKFIGFAVTVYLSYIIVYSGTRSVLLSYVMVVAFALYVYYKDTLKVKGDKSIAGMVFLVIAIASPFILYKYIFLPMQELRIASPLDGNRFRIWARYLSIFINDTRILLFGVGASSITKFANLIETGTVHNGYIEKLIEFGIVGMILLIILMVSVLKGHTLNPFKNHYAMPLYIYLASILTLGITGAELPFFLVGIGCANYKIDEETYLLKNRM